MSSKPEPVVAVLKDEYKNMSINSIIDSLSSSEKGALIPLSLRGSVLFCRGHYVAALINGMLPIASKFPELQEAIFSLPYFKKVPSC